MKNILLMLALFLAVCNTAHTQHDSKLTAGFDQVLKEQFPLNETGVTVLVSSRGKIIYTKVLGIANVELRKPMQKDNVFRIASITKQFTAVAILQLMEQGKLSLQDEITKYIPDYPVQGKQITIEHLLTHTSGIRDFSTITDTVQRGKLDFMPKEMIDYFQAQPLRFAPGTKYEYSNSNYFLLGYILENITGKTYQQYLEDHFFKPLGMQNSYYDRPSKIIKNRTGGYTRVKGELQNATVISMTQPYAAGAILSTVEDLFKWQQAVLSYKLIKKSTLEKAFTRYKLVNGKEINYGYGWRFGFIQESPSIWHGGLINGFMTMALYLPKEDVYVVVFSNCDCVSPEIATAKLAAVAIGKPYTYKEVAVSNDVLKTYRGVYENNDGDQLFVSVTDGDLYAQRGRAPKVLIKAFKKDHFVFNDPLITMEFGTDGNGKIDKLTIHSRNGNEVWNKSHKSAVSQAEIKVDEKILDTYVGQYEVTPQFTFVITKEKERLFLQATGQEKLEMFADSNTKFSLKVNDAQLEFVNESGQVSKAILKQGGRTADAKKIK